MSSALTTAAPAPLRADEDAALEALAAVAALDSAPEDEFDALVRVAAAMCEAPIALLTLVDADRVWFKARIGVGELQQVPRQETFCAHTILGAHLHEVEDAWADPHFAQLPHVAGGQRVRHYAGVALTLTGGARVGALCVLDRQPRRLEPRQREVLAELARVASRALDARRAAARLRESAHLLEYFLDRAGRLARVGGWALDLRTQVLTWSDQTRRIHEVEPDYVPTVDAGIAFYAPEAQPVIRAAVQTAVEHGTPWDLELPLITATGRRLWVRAFGEAEFLDGRPVRLVGAFSDISEGRRRQIELQEEQARRQQLERHSAEIECLLRERSEMLDVLAHEVRQPLNSASAALQSAASALSGGDDPLAEPRLRRAQAVLGQVMGVLDNTLAVAALLARPGPIERGDADVDALLELVLAELSAASRQRVRVERLTGTRTVAMDTSLMRLALRNLLRNALNYATPGTPVTLRVSDSDEPLALLIDVIDQGPGFSPELLPRLFQRGARAARWAAGRPAPSTGETGAQPAPEQSGLGLGLYIVRRVMELHGGTVQLLANGPAGATLRLVLVQPLGD